MSSQGCSRKSSKDCKPPCKWSKEPGAKRASCVSMLAPVKAGVQKPVSRPATSVAKEEKVAKEALDWKDLPVDSQKPTSHGEIVGMCIIKYFAGESQTPELRSKGLRAASDFGGYVSYVRSAYSTKDWGNRFIVGAATEYLFSHCLHDMFRVYLCTADAVRNDVYVLDSDNRVDQTLAQGCGKVGVQLDRNKKLEYSLKYAKPVNTSASAPRFKYPDIIMINYGRSGKQEGDTTKDINEDIFLIIPNPVVVRSGEPIVAENEKDRWPMRDSTGKIVRRDPLCGKLVFLPKRMYVDRKDKAFKDGLAQMELRGEFVERFVQRHPEYACDVNIPLFSDKTIDSTRELTNAAMERHDKDKKRPVQQLDDSIFLCRR